MKRPEGFDPTPQKPPQKAMGNRGSGAKPPTQKARASTAGAPRTGQPAPVSQRSAKREPAPEPRQPIRGASRSPRPDASARAELRRAARERRRVERAEVRRFTRRARHRRIGVGIVAGVIVSLAALVFVAVYSPLLALRTITVDGTSRVDPAEVTAAVQSQLGTPLALLNYDTITEQLSAFPLIRSYVTEIVPPSTLLVHVTERQPVGSVVTGAGFDVVDPAGVTVQQSTERLPGVPLIDVGAAGVSGPAFDAVVEVLLSLPPELLAQVDRASATTRDNVSLVLTGVGQGVTWGSADDSAKKAALLAALISLTDSASPGVFDVSAPGNGVFRPS